MNIPMFINGYSFCYIVWAVFLTLNWEKIDFLMTK